MFKFETAMSRPSAHELQRRARREQARMVNAVIGSSTRKLAGLLGDLAQKATRAARMLVAELRIRRDIRALRQFGDRTLHDMGVTRGEIEQVVRYGQPWHGMDWAGYAAPATANRRGEFGRTRPAV